jgi:hypothetical protein
MSQIGRYRLTSMVSSVSRTHWARSHITNQLASHATKKDALGISAEDAEIPRGKYKITLQISDTNGRIGTQEFSFQVV